MSVNTCVNEKSNGNQEKLKSATRKGIMGIQHVVAMFGATVLVPMLTGLNPSVALFSAGFGTLLFHLVTKGIVPVFLGSSFAFIPVIVAVANKYGDLRYAQGGIVVAGGLYMVFSLMIKIFGADKVKSFFPPIVTGPMIIVIGLILSPTAIEMASANWLVASVVVITVTLVSVFAKGFFKVIPILCGVLVGYAFSAFLGIIDYSPILEASYFSMPEFTAPKFSFGAVAMIAPIVLAVFMEHIGDITTNGAVVGKNFFEEPGVHRTLLGDGIATLFAGFIGAPANTTYGENTSVLAVTKNYNPSILRLAACIAITLSFIGKLGAILQTIPVPVMGGVSIILFGMIASVGLRTLTTAEVDFSSNRNLIVASLILVAGIGTEILKIKQNLNAFDGVIGIQITDNIQIVGLSLAAIIGICVNKLLPETA
ncbi:MAG: uracil permease [Firmicutes bacterium]|nr:uracil permease [Bacillota bacterium]